MLMLAYRWDGGETWAALLNVVSTNTVCFQMLLDSHEFSFMLILFFMFSALSPRQQNAMRGALRAYVFYGYKRIITQVPYFAIPFGLCKYHDFER
jgi:hypothetical protein